MLECLGLKECEGKPKVNYVTVFERPGLREFLKQLSEFSELVLFTAGLEGIKITLPCFLDSLLPFLKNNFLNLLSLGAHRLRKASC